MPEPESPVPEFPVPPYRVRVHREAPPHDPGYRHALQQIELAGWYQQALHVLAGVAAAVRASSAFAADLSIEVVEAGGAKFHAIEVQNLVVFFWVSHSTRTIYILHSQPARIFRAYGKQGRWSLPSAWGQSEPLTSGGQPRSRHETIQRAA
jgi:hypothetical protein